MQDLREMVPSQNQHCPPKELLSKEYGEPLIQEPWVLNVSSCFLSKMRGMDKMIF